MANGVQSSVSITDRISGPLKAAAQNAKLLYESMDSVNAAVKAVENRDLGGLSSSTSSAEKAMKGLATGTEAGSKAVQGLEKNTGAAAKAVQALGTAATVTGKGLSVMASGVQLAGKSVKALGTGVTGIGKAVQSVGSGITGFGSAVESVGSGLSKIGMLGTGAVTALAGIGATAANTALDFIKLYESSSMVFERMLGGKDAANEMYTDLLKIAKASTFSQETFLEAGKSLVGVGVSAENTTTYLQAITDAVAGFGGSSAQIEQISQAFRKVATNGRISMMEVNQLADAGVNVMTILANSYGKTTEEMRDMISYHPELLGGAEVLNVLAEGIEKGTNGVNGATAAMEGMAKALKGKTLTGQFDSLHSSVRSFSLALIGMNPTLKEGEEGYEKSEKRIRQLTAALSKVNEILPATAKLFSGMTDGIGKMLDKLIGSDPVFDEATGTWQNAGGVLTGLAEKIKAMPEVKIPGLTEIPGQLEAIIPGFDRIEEKIKSLATSDKLFDNAKKILEGTYNLIFKLEGKVADLRDKLKDSDSPIFQLAAKGLDILMDGMEKAKRLTEAVFKGFENLNNGGSFFDGISEKFQDMGGIFAKVGDWFKNLDPEQLSTLTGIVFKLISLSPMLLVFGKGISIVAKPIKMIGKLFGGLGSGIVTAGGLIKNIGKGVMGVADIFGGLSDKVKDAGDWLSNFGKDSESGEKGSSFIGDFVSKSLGNLKDEGQKTGSMLTDMFSSGIDSIKETTLAEKLSGKLTKAKDSALGLVGKTKGKFSDLITGTGEKIANSKLGKGVSGIGTAIKESPVGQVTGKAFGGIGKALEGASSFLGPVASQFGGLISAFMGAMPIFAGVALGIGAITLALGLLNKEGGGSEAVTNFFTGFTEKISSFKDIAVEKIGEFSNWIVENGPELGKRGLELVEALIEGMVNSGGALLDAGVSILGSLGMGLLNAAPTLIQMGIDAISGLITFLQEKTPEWAMRGLEWIISLGRGLAENLPTIMEKATEIVTTLINGIANNFPTIISGGIEMLKNLIGGIIEHLPEIIDTAWSIAQGFFTGIMDNLPTILDAGWNLLTSLVGGILSGLGELAKAAIELVVLLGKTLWDNRHEILNKMGEVLKSLGESVANAAVSIGDSIIHGIWNGIVGAWNWLCDKWDDLIGGLSSAVNWLFPDTSNKKVAGMAGYATGTRSAAAGLALVGEEGPELIDFGGGETVYNNSETKSILNAGESSPRSLEPMQAGNSHTVNSGDIKIDMSGWNITGSEEFRQSLDNGLEKFRQALLEEISTGPNKLHAVTA